MRYLQSATPTDRLKRLELIFKYFILLITPLTAFSQGHQVYFSVTSDTVLFKSRKDKETDSIFNFQSFTVLSAVKKTTTVVSHFIVRPETDPLYKEISLPDTLSKYSLTTKGSSVKPTDLKAFVISLKHDGIIIQDTAASKKVFLFKTKITVSVKFKHDTLISKHYPFVFKGQSSEDFNKIELYHAEAFEDPKTGKVLIELSLRDKPVITRPDKTPSYFFSYYNFIL